MLPLHEAREALAAVDLRHGLTVDEVHARLAQGMRLHQAGERILAHYQSEMEAQGLPNQEEAWLEQARSQSCPERAPPGRPPLLGEPTGRPDVLHTVSISMGPRTRHKFDLVKQKLGVQLGRTVDDAECLSVLADLMVRVKVDGTSPSPSARRKG